jgi:hypothetical protein
MGEVVDLSVIIVNWKSAEYVRACLSDLYAHTTDLKFETVVIDNASYDGCGNMLDQEFPQVEFLQSTENRGFGCANNIGFDHCRGPVVLFLNPDTQVREGAIQRMLETVQGRPDAGVIGARLLNSDGSLQTSCVQAYPSISGILMDSELLRNWFPRWSLWGISALFVSSTGAQAVQGVSGACQMLRREVFLRAGKYNPAYFMYSEDMDLCFTIERLGLKNLYVQDAVVVHHGGKSSSSAPESGWAAIVMRESWKRFFEQHHGRSYAWTYQALVVAQATVRLTALILATVIARCFGRGKDLRMIQKKWIRILRWALGLERWATFPAQSKPALAEA